MKRTVLLMALLLLPTYGLARCGTIPMNPVTDVCWECMYPIKIGGGIPALGAQPTCSIDVPGANAAGCLCMTPKPTFGAPISYWEPYRIIETVKDAWCFPSIGVDLVEAPGRDGSKSSIATTGAAKIFRQVHYMVFPAGEILKNVINSKCMSIDGVDQMYITEVDPLWNDDVLSALAHPESVLFANPFAQLACAADSIGSLWCANSSMFWCMGSWGSSYPLTGHISGSREMSGNAGLAARIIFKLGRQGMLWDAATNICNPTPTPVWIKHHYRLHLAKPFRAATCSPIGQSEMAWSSFKQVPYNDGNYAWLMFRQKGCCASHY